MLIDCYHPANPGVNRDVKMWFPFSPPPVGEGVFSRARISSGVIRQAPGVRRQVFLWAQKLTNYWSFFLKF